jgi:uncharacterized NAD(P)/FAD-binding protein YdhS
MSHEIQRRIAIVGAGFSGTATAIQLLRHARARPLEITLIERGPDFGRGVAYAKRAFPYLLNVPAARMAATTDDPDAFLRFAQRRDSNVAGQDFLPRALYGDYLQELLDGAAHRPPGGTQVRRAQGEAVAVSIAEKSAPVVVTLADSTQLGADHLVLASGHPEHRLPGNVGCGLKQPVLRPDPWTEGRKLAGRGPIAILGTGLTMVDVVCEAIARHPGVEIHAISRHGLLAPSQTAFRPDALENDGEALARCPRLTRQLMAVVRALAAEAESRGGDWREVITLVRRALPSLWASVGPVERSRFLRHVRSYWDIHRHRLPGGVVAHLAQLRKSGQLVIHAGRALSLDPVDGGARVTWMPRGAARTRVLNAVEVVPCTGSQSDVTRSDDRLWSSLLGLGLVVPDELRLGIRTAGGALLNRAGRPSDRLFYVGPLLRADHWEATAVAELRMHAEALARRLLS